MPKPELHSPEPSASAPFNAEAYVQQALQLLALDVSPKQQTVVMEQFERIRAIAQPILDFPLPDDLEAAPTFEP